MTKLLCVFLCALLACLGEAHVLSGAPSKCLFNVTELTPLVLNDKNLHGRWYLDSTTAWRDEVFCQRADVSVPQAMHNKRIDLNYTLVAAGVDVAGEPVVHASGYIVNVQAPNKFNGTVTIAQNGHKEQIQVWFMATDKPQSTYIMLYLCADSGFYQGEQVMVLSRDKNGVPYETRLKLQTELQKRFGWKAYLAWQLNVDCP